MTEKYMYDPAIVEGRFIDGILYKIWHKKLKNILKTFEGKWLWVYYWTPLGGTGTVHTIAVQYMIMYVQCEY